MATQLTPHFTLEGLCESSTATRLGIDNTPPDNLIGNAYRLAEGLEQVQSVLGSPIHHSSGYRCEALERVLSSKDFAHWCELHAKSDADWPEYFERKQHPEFEAEDFTCPQFGTPLEVVKLIAGSTIQFDQCIQEGTWVHISFTETPRREVLTAHFAGGKVTYTNGLA